MKGTLIKIGLVFGLVIVLLSTNITPGLLGRSNDSVQQKSVDALLIPTTEKSSVFSLNVFGTTNLKKQEVALSADDATLIFEKLRELKSEMTQHPYSEKTRSLKVAFVNLLDEKGLIPNGESKETYLSLLSPRWVERLRKTGNPASSLPQSFTNRGTCALCSVGGGGSGMLIPLFLLPRPRIAMLWLGNGLTTATNLITTRGYVAEGAQTGFTLGFMGIGITYALPGYMMYGFIGYALLASTTAEYVEHYPPNRAPVISDANPTNGEQNVPLSLTELQFRITDPDGNLMSYSVTTEPDIGSGSGNLKPFGVYTVPVSGLVDLTKYTWHIQVTDGKDTTEETLTFTTEAIAPIISNPIPADGERDVPIDIPSLRFTLKDYQGDAMEYTVQTSPNIGTDHKIGVHDGTYTVSLSGLMHGAAYHWFLNVTDGTHWTRKIFTFETIYPEQFNPFDLAWHYRKQITIDHSKVAGNLTNFPVLVSTVDVDLSQKTQDDGDDILFMNAPGVATRLNYEIEQFDANSGKLVAWVNITTLSSNDDTTFYMYYGNPTCLTQQYPEKTWDSNYKVVYHMNDLTTSTILDSTSNSNNGTKTSANNPTEANAKMGKGQIFTGDDYITKTITGMSGVMTVSGWVYTTGTATQPRIINFACAATAGLDMGHRGSTNPSAGKAWVDGNAYANTNSMAATTTVNDGTWHYVLVVKSTTTQYNLYVDDGAAEVTEAGTNSVFSRIFIGERQDGSSFFTGTLDEIRISDTNRSANWISTEFNNQNNPSSFLSFGPEVPGP